MHSIRVAKASENSDNLDYDLVKIDLPKLAEGECLIEVHASSVNPSDVKAILGVMPDLKWPRTPGRNYSGIVVDGDTRLIGKEVWGTGGDLGMSRDGSHAEYMIVEAGSVREKPANISMFEAAQKMIFKTSSKVSYELNKFIENTCLTPLSCISELQTWQTPF